MYKSGIQKSYSQSEDASQQISLSLAQSKQTATQQRIAAILDKADALREKRRQSLAKLDTLLQSVFLDMFGDPVTNPKGFKKKTLGEVVKVKSGEFLPEKDFGKDGIYPVYGGNGVSGFHSEYLFAEPVIVIGRVGQYCGSVHLTKSCSWITDNALYIAERSDSLVDTYLVAALKHANLNQYAGRSAQPLISGGRIYPVPIIEPPLDLQRQFAERTGKVGMLKIQVQEGLAMIDNLFSSLQQRAFTGELFAAEARDVVQQELFGDGE